MVVRKSQRGETEPLHSCGSLSSLTHRARSPFPGETVQLTAQAEPIGRPHFDNREDLGCANADRAKDTSDSPLGDNCAASSRPRTSVRETASQAQKKDAVYGSSRMMDSKSPDPSRQGRLSRPTWHKKRNFPRQTTTSIATVSYLDKNASHFWLQT